MRWRTLHNRKRWTRRKARAAYYGRFAALVMLRAWEDGVAMGRKGAEAMSIDIRVTVEPCDNHIINVLGNTQ